MDLKLFSSWKKDSFNEHITNCFKVSSMCGCRCLSVLLGAECIRIYATCFRDRRLARNYNRSRDLVGSVRELFLWALERDYPLLVLPS